MKDPTEKHSISIILGIISNLLVVILLFFLPDENKTYLVCLFLILLLGFLLTGILKHQNFINRRSGLEKRIKEKDDTIRDKEGKIDDFLKEISELNRKLSTCREELNQKPIKSNGAYSNSMFPPSSSAFK